MPKERPLQEAGQLPRMDPTDIGNVLSGVLQPTLLKLTSTSARKYAVPYLEKVSASGEAVHSVGIEILASGEQNSFPFEKIAAIDIAESVLAEQENFYLLNSVPPVGVPKPSDGVTPRMIRKHPKLGIRNPDGADPIVSGSLELLRRELPTRGMTRSMGKSITELPKGQTSVDVTVDVLSGRILGLEKPSVRLGDMEHQHMTTFRMRDNLVEGIKNLDDRDEAVPLMDNNARRRIEDAVYFFNQDQIQARGGEAKPLYPLPWQVKK